MTFHSAEAHQSWNSASDRLVWSVRGQRGFLKTRPLSHTHTHTHTLHAVINKNIIASIKSNIRIYIFICLYLWLCLNISSFVIIMYRLKFTGLQMKNTKHDAVLRFPFVQLTLKRTTPFALSSALWVGGDRQVFWGSSGPQLSLLGEIGRAFLSPRPRHQSSLNEDSPKHLRL